MNKVDIIIPTYNRTDYLKRILNYYQKYGCDFNFIVADSSSPENKKSNKELISSYKKLKILYIDKFSPNLIQSRKFAEMVKYVKNKYVCFCADDDFIIPTAISAAVNFLEKNPDYAAAHGTYIGFHTFNPPLGRKHFLWGYRNTPQTISSSEPLERLKSHLQNYTLVNWAVRRTVVVKKSYAEFSKVKLDPYIQAILGELIPDCLTVIYGKVKNLNLFYGARQYFGSVISFYPNFTDAKAKGKYDSEYGKFKTCLLNNLEKLSIPKGQSEPVIDLAMQGFLNHSYQEYLVNNLYAFLSHSPRILPRIIRLLHISYLFSKEKIHTLGRVDNPSSKFHNDFETIRQSVLKSNI